MNCKHPRITGDCWRWVCACRGLPAAAGANEHHVDLPQHIMSRRRLNGYLAELVPSPPGKRTCQPALHVDLLPRTAGKPKILGTRLAGAEESERGTGSKSKRSIAGCASEDGIAASILWRILATP